MLSKIFLRACFWALFLFATINTCGQYDTTAFYVKRYTAFDGLPDSYTLDVFQDSKRYLWIGTYSGLSRFDGIAFSNFGIRDGFKDQYVTKFIEFDNHIWVGNRTSVGYIHKNRFVQTFFEDSTKRLSFVYGFNVLPSGKLCVITSKGLYEWNDSLWRKSLIIPEMKEEDCQNVIELHGRVYFFFFNKIIVLEKNGDKRTIPISAEEDFYQLPRKFGDQVFITTKKGLFEIQNYNVIPVFSRDLDGKIITFFYRDSEKRFWVATRDGLMASRPGDLNELTFKMPIRPRLTLGICEDISHNIWVADNSGLYKIRKSFFTIHSFPLISGSSNWYFPFLNAKQQVNIFRDKVGLLKFTGDKFQTEKFIRENYFKSPTISTIRGLKQVCYDDQENAWVSIRNNKLIKISNNGSQKEINLPSPWGYSSILVAWAPHLKKILCGASELYTIENDSLKVYIPPNTGKPLENVFSIFVLKNGNVLVNCVTSGIWVIDSLGNAYQPKISTAANRDFRINFAEDKQGKLWIAFTGMGIQRFNWANDTVLIKEAELSTLNKGLPNDIVETMAVDGKNRLWAITLSGVVIVDTLSGNEGKDFFTFNLSAIENIKTEISGDNTHLLADVKGDIWFANHEKIIHFNTRLIDLYSSSPVTHIEEIKLNMKKTNWNKWCSELDNYFMLPQNLSLPYNQNTLTFSFKGINYSSDDKIWYSYKLLGVDTSWGPATLSNSVSFIKLMPNDFTFLVRSRNTNSMWSEPASFSFTVRKPFWQTWGFRIMGILISSVILGLIFSVQLKRVRKRARLENQLRDLEMKALKAQMNPHFIYNALNSIQSLVIDDKGDDALDYMVKFSRLLRQVLNHSELNTVSLAKELESLKLYIQLESLRLHYSLNYSITVDDNITPEMEKIPPMIIQPFIENALWHGLSNKEGNKNLQITIKGEDEFLKFDIVDNGIGRAKASLTKKTETYNEGPRGMEITKSRLSVFNNSEKVEPFSVHDILDDNNNAGGTMITVRVRRS